jgi:hypothetical protein
MISFACGCIANLCEMMTGLGLDEGKTNNHHPSIHRAAFCSLCALLCCFNDEQFFDASYPPNILRLSSLRKSSIASV